jgi:hypothetical protein
MNSRKYIIARKAARVLQVANHKEQPKVVYDILPPVETRGGVRKYDHFYPFEDMKPGGSFWVESSSRCTLGAVTKFAKKTGWKFMTRAQTEDGRANNEVRESKNVKRGTRVWRLK